MAEDNILRKRLAQTDVINEERSKDVQKSWIPFDNLNKIKPTIKECLECVGI